MSEFSKSSPSQIAVLATVVPDGNGGFIIKAKKPLPEVGPRDAATILGCNISYLGRILNEPRARKIIKWRWVNVVGGKRIFDSASLIAFRQAMTDLARGQSAERQNTARKRKASGSPHKRPA